MQTPGMTRAILMVHGHRCQYCGGVATHADHIIPSILGGREVASNLTAACAGCNCSKGHHRLQPEHEREMLSDAWFCAGVVEDMVRSYKHAVAGAKSQGLRRAAFIKMTLIKSLEK